MHSLFLKKSIDYTHVNKKKSSSKQCKAIYLDRTIRLISVALLIFFKQDRTGSGKKKNTTNES